MTITNSKYLIYVESTVNNGFQFIQCANKDKAEKIVAELNKVGTLKATLIAI